MDGEGGPQDVPISNTFTFFADCLLNVRIEVWYFSREYPEYTGQQSIWNDLVEYEVRHSDGVIASGSARVNSLHDVFDPLGNYPGGSYLADVIDVGSSGTVLTLTGPATNIEDDLLGSGVAFVITCDGPGFGGPGGFQASQRPPDGDDRTFVVDEDPALDAGCGCGVGPTSIEFDIPVTRYAGETDPNGHLVMADTLVANALISPYATLMIMAWDVDSSLPGAQTPERDRVFFNGKPVNVLGPGNDEFLHGTGGKWRMNCFRIPIENIKFPSAPGVDDPNKLALPPVPMANSVRIDLATAGGNTPWCTSIDWAALLIDAMSPIVLIHGINSDGSFFERQGFTLELSSLGLVWQNHILLAKKHIFPRTNRVTNDALDLNTLLPKVATAFGVDSIHLVCHSKGGLDAREYLARFHRNNAAIFAVISYTSLSTPHEGSIMADLIIAYNEKIQQVADIDFSQFPDFQQLLGNMLQARTPQLRPGYRDLTTAAATQFNAGNLSKLPRDIAYHAVAADADLNLNGMIDLNPDEFAALRNPEDGPELQLLFGVDPEKARRMADMLYQVMKNDSLVVEKSTDPDVDLVFRLVAPPSGVANQNDTLVSVASGLGTSGFDSVTSANWTFVGQNGRNHASIGDQNVAALVWTWLQTAERERGDLKPR